MLSSFFTGLCAAPLFYMTTAWLVKAINQHMRRPSNRLAVAYLSTTGGFVVMIAGFFMTWFVTYLFLLPHYFRVIQVADVVAVLGWTIVVVYNIGQHTDYV